MTTCVADRCGRGLMLVLVAGCAAGLVGCSGGQKTAPEPIAAWPQNDQSNTSVTMAAVPPTAPVATESNWNSSPTQSSENSGDTQEGFDGSSSTRVTFAEEGADFDPSVSQDGKWLVFASTQHRKTSDIYIKRTDSRVVTQLTQDPADDVTPTLSPDGKRVAFASNRGGNWDLFVMPVQGGRALRLTSEPSDELMPSWSPDGKKIVYNRVNGGKHEMWLLNLNAPATPTFIGYGHMPRWCPKAGTGATGGDLIAFQQPRDRGNRTISIWTVEYKNGQTSSQTEVASSTAAAYINPAWSPDGEWIAFAEVPVNVGTTAAAGRADGGIQKSALWMVTAQGEIKTKLTDGTGLALNPSWSGGYGLFFVSNRSGHENVWSVDLRETIAAAKETFGNDGNRTAKADENAAENGAEMPMNGGEEAVANVATEPEPQ